VPAQALRCLEPHDDDLEIFAGGLQQPLLLIELQALIRMHWLQPRFFVKRSGLIRAEHIGGRDVDDSANFRATRRLHDLFQQGRWAFAETKPAGR